MVWFFPSSLLDTRSLWLWKSVQRVHCGRLLGYTAVQCFSFSSRVMTSVASQYTREKMLRRHRKKALGFLLAHRRGCLTKNYFLSVFNRIHLYLSCHCVFPDWASHVHGVPQTVCTRRAEDRLRNHAIDYKQNNIDHVIYERKLHTADWRLVRGLAHNCHFNIRI